MNTRKQIQTQIQKTSDQQKGEGNRKEQDRGVGLRDTNYYV